MGNWYEIASIPAWFEKGCEKTFQNLSMNPDRTIKIDNGCTNKKGA
jgi:lipocalin